MITALTNAYRKAWQTSVTLYKTAAFVALVAWIAVGVSAQHSGYAQVTLPLGTTISQVDASQLSAPAAAPAKQKIEKHADASPLPGEKPPVPPTPAQVGR
jgi:hypothetical protein